jgi:hypothetical protein
VVLRNSGQSLLVFAYGTVTLYGLSFQYNSANQLRLYASSYNPAMLSITVWAFPRSLATTNRMISFPRATKMFQFTRFPSLTYFIQPGIVED